MSWGPALISSLKGSGPLPLAMEADLHVVFKLLPANGQSPSAPEPPPVEADPAVSSHHLRPQVSLQKALLPTISSGTASPT